MARVAGAVPESAVQRMILAQLIDRKFCFWRSNTGMARTRTGFVRFGTPGQPDIQGCYRGRWVGIEVKAEHGKLSPQQFAFKQRIEQAGGAYIVARNWEEVEHGLNGIW